MDKRLKTKKPKNMVTTHPIICHTCQRDTGMTTEQFMFYVVTTDIKCPHCGAVIIRANNGISFSAHQSQTTTTHQL